MSEQIRINDLDDKLRWATLVDVDWNERLICLSDAGTILVFDGRTGLSIKVAGIGFEGQYWIAKSQYDVVVRLAKELVRNNNARAKYRNQFDPFEPENEDQSVDYDSLLEDAMSD